MMNKKWELNFDAATERQEQEEQDEQEEEEEEQEPCAKAKQTKQRAKQRKGGKQLPTKKTTVGRGRKRTLPS